MTITRSRRCGEQGNSATEVKEKQNGDNSDSSGKRINSKEAIWAAEAAARTE
jgi:hypothetical protein